MSPDRRGRAPRARTVPAALIMAAALALAVQARPARAVELNGPAQVLDGNSIVIGGRRIGLYGIEAPDEDQVCQRRSGAWRCGQEAGWALAERLERHWVLCDTRPAPEAPAEAAPDALSAVCYLDGRRIDVNAWMVEQGWALADRTAAAYVAQEQAAQRAGRGLWSGKFDPPWEWRARKR